MKRVIAGITSCALALAVAGQAEAFTETGEKETIPVAATGSVTASTTFDVVVVVQGTADTPGVLGWGAGGNSFRDSDEALKVTVDTNLAANRVITYTDNLGISASPQACLDTATGIDGGGLVGESDCSQTVPVLWVVKDTNVNHAFTTGTIGDDEIFITDRAHVATFTPVDSALDNQSFVRCDDGVTPVANTNSNGLYPQFFGTAGANNDLCDSGDGTTVLSQELSKNIAVVAFGFLGTGGTAPNTDTADPTDVVAMTSPIYMPVGADFSLAPAQTYSTNTLTVELITQ